MEVRIFMVLQLGKKILACYRTHKFIIVFARAEIIYLLWQYIMNNCESTLLLFLRAKFYDLKMLKFIDLIQLSLTDRTDYLQLLIIIRIRKLNCIFNRVINLIKLSP